MSTVITAEPIVNVITNQANISMIRGDTFAFSVTMKDEKTKDIIPFVNGDQLYFTVKQSGYEKHKLIGKVIKEFESNGSAIIRINPKDTKDIPFGSYVYDVELIAKNGNVNTIVPCSQFTIKMEVTDNGC